MSKVRFEIEPGKADKATLDNIIEMVEKCYAEGDVPKHVEMQRAEREQSKHWARKFEEAAREAR